MSSVPPIIRGGLEVSAEQAAVIDHVLSQPLTVADAGAGAGKTHTTVAAVFELMMQCPDARIGQFALITFTNKAADELTSRLARTLRAIEADAPDATWRRRWTNAHEQLGNAYVGTIHGFCREILKTFGYGAEVARLSDLDFAGGLLYESTEEAVEEMVLSAPDNALRRALGRTWRLHDLEKLGREVYQSLRNSGCDPAAILAATRGQNYGTGDGGHDFRVALAEFVCGIHTRYEAKKREGQRLDSTDLLLRTEQVLADIHGPAIIRKLSARYRYLFVDEFQDTDPVQLRIVELLRPQLERVLLVGDGKQSIYRFRGAGISLAQISQEKAGAAPLRLSISRRPTVQLLTAYNSLFRSMSARYRELGDPLQPHGGTLQATNKLPPIAFLSAGGRDEMEARIARTAKAIRGLIKRQLDTSKGPRNLEPGDIAILFRLNRDRDKYESGLREELCHDNIEVRTDSSGGFYRRPEVVGVYRLLRFLLEHPNDIVTLHAMETPYLRHLDLKSTVASILWYGRKRGHELTDRFEREHPNLAARFRQLRSAVKTDTVPELLGLMDELLSLRKFHSDIGDRAGEEGLERLREIARSLVRSEQALTVGAFVRHLGRCIRDDAEGPEPVAPDDAEDTRPPYVRLMTVHAAKGLEFPVVIIPEMQAPVGSRGSSGYLADAQAGLDINVRPLSESIPTHSPLFWTRSRADKSVAVFEEMRVFYVAVTRAQNHVILVGSDDGRVRPPTDKEYGWQDEVLVARQLLQPHGVIFPESSPRGLVAPVRSQR